MFHYNIFMNFLEEFPCAEMHKKNMLTSLNSYTCEGLVWTSTIQLNSLPIWTVCRSPEPISWNHRTIEQVRKDPQGSSNSWVHTGPPTICLRVLSKCDHCPEESVPVPTHSLSEQPDWTSLSQLPAIPLGPATVPKEQRSVPAHPLPSWGRCRPPLGLPSVSHSLGWTNQMTSDVSYTSSPLNPSLSL